MKLILYVVLEIYGATEIIFCHFGPFFALSTSWQPWKSKFWNWKTFFCPFAPPPPLPPLNNLKNQHFEKMKKMRLEMSSFYTCVPKIKIIWCIVPEIWSMTQNFLWFWTVFCPFTELTTRKIKILKKWKKDLKILSFYTCVPKMTI